MSVLPFPVLSFEFSELTTVLIIPQNEKRSICVALGNDLAYVVRAVAPNFVWKVFIPQPLDNSPSFRLVLSVLNFSSRFVSRQPHSLELRKECPGRSDCLLYSVSVSFIFPKIHQYH